MEPIFPISALQKDAAAVRAAAKDSIVRLTVDGRGMYIFSTEELFEEYVQRRIREALLEQRITEGIDRGLRDIEEGRYIALEEGMAQVWEKRGKRATG